MTERVLPESSAEFVVVHLRFALAGAPKPCHLIRVFDHKLPVVPLPGNHIMILLLPQQL